jgi:DNA-3-methyladenine glycosylase II
MRKPNLGRKSVQDYNSIAYLRISSRRTVSVHLRGAQKAAVLLEWPRLPQDRRSLNPRRNLASLPAVIRTIETSDDIAEGIAHLTEADPRLRTALARSGAIPLRRRAQGLDGLIDIIIAQQVSVASATAIAARFRSHFPANDAAALAEATEADFRACGLSSPKIRAIKAIAAAIRAEELHFGRLADLPADEAHKIMCAIKGIGPWTADIYLMFCLGHADAFAAGDLALQEALRQIYGLDARPTARQLLDYAEAWRPWRAVAARLLWSYYKVVKTREGVV